jgi:transcriptional regulator of acetoin/glycerol metabolism
VLERAMLLSDHPLLEPDDLIDSASATVATATPSPRLTLAAAERRHIEAVLREVRGAVSQAAAVLGLSRSALYERIKKHGIALPKP